MHNFTKWSPKNYLKQYYDFENLVYDEVVIFKFIIHFLRMQNKKFSSMLDFGAGPTIHRIIPFIPYVEDIYIADYLASNLNEIKLWLKSSKNSHDWSKQIQHILRLEAINEEGKISNRKVKDRINSTRTKKISLVRCNVFAKRPLPTKKVFPLVTSFYCVDSIVSSKKEWRQAMKNLLSLVQPGGFLVLSALKDTKRYQVGQYYFPSPNLHRNDFIDILSSNGFDKKQIKMKVISAARWRKEGINSLLVLSAMKNHDVSK